MDMTHVNPRFVEWYGAQDQTTRDLIDQKWHLTAEDDDIAQGTTSGLYARRYRTLQYATTLGYDFE